MPEDDGAADHLSGMALPELRLPSTSNETVNLAEIAIGCLVAYVYPRTGTPGQPSPSGWDGIPRSCGCRPSRPAACP